jgi:hypothetical protein
MAIKTKEMKRRGWMDWPNEGKGERNGHGLGFGLQLGLKRAVKREGAVKGKGGNLLAIFRWPIAVPSH